MVIIAPVSPPKAIARTSARPIASKQRAQKQWMDRSNEIDEAHRMNPRYWRLRGNGV